MRFIEYLPGKELLRLAQKMILSKLKMTSDDPSLGLCIQTNGITEHSVHSVYSDDILLTSAVVQKETENAMY